MKYLPHKINDKLVSKLGIGAARFGTLVGEDTAFELLDMFTQYGGTLIDTARNYYEWVDDGRGKSEEFIGKWLVKRNNREKIVISTKGGVRNEGHEWFYDLSYNALEREIKESLESLKTEYIDIYLLHRDESQRPVEEIVDTMQKIKEIGNVQKIGVSNWPLERIKSANEYAQKNNLEPFTIVQTWWSLADYTDAMWNDPTTTHMTDELYEYMRSQNMIGMAYTSQCKGYFQKAAQLGIENIDDFLRKRIETPSNIKKASYIKYFSEKNKISPTAFVTGYITNNPLQGIALFSTMNIEHLRELLEWSDYTLPLFEIHNIDHCI